MSPRLILLAAACGLPLAVPARAAGLSAWPAQVRLTGPGAAQQLVAWETRAGGETVDRTRTARYSVLDPRVARVSPDGMVTPVADGATRVRIRRGAEIREVPIRVLGARAPRTFSFANDIAPVLSRAGCNSGTCHGKAEGQHGFKLSVFGYDLPADYEAITRGALGRRVLLNDPARSLFLLKATGAIPHAGGVRFTTDSAHYRLLADWIAAGAPYGPADAPTLARIAVFPPERALLPNGGQPLLVTAFYSDGTSRDVTREARFGSNSPAVAGVDESGMVRSSGRAGEAAVMASYSGAVAVSRIRIPQPPEPVAAGNAPRRLPELTLVDRPVWDRLDRLRIRPSRPATDSEFIRRAYLDLLGALPTPEEVRAFLAECELETGSQRHLAAAGGSGDAPPAPRNRGELAGAKPASLEGGEGKAAAGSASNSSPQAAPVSVPQNSPRYRGDGGASLPTAAANRQLAPALKARVRLVDRLLERSEYADYWALQWSDLLRVNREKLGAKGAYSFYRWIHDALESNKPYDRFIQELVTASGSSSENGAVNFFRVLAKPEERAATVSQVFLGVRIECAQCHHHPFERWSQNDYYGMVGYFTGLKSRAAGAGTEILTPSGGADAVNPRTSQPVPARPLQGAPSDLAGTADRRGRLAEWMVRPDNPFVARMISNRLWAHFMGRGLVEPVDDFRDTNPPSNPELLDALARRLVESRYDLKALIRAIMNSQAYQLSGESNPSNRADDQNFSRAYPKRLPAEVLLDAVSQATGTPPEFRGLPRGVRAVQMWDSDWSLQWQSYFLNAFGRPPRTSPCECERSQEPTIAQVLHLMNAPEIQAQLAGQRGRARMLAGSTRTDAEVIDELFLAAYARHPTLKEGTAARELFAHANEDRAQAAEDLLWALINTTEFVFNH